MLNLVEKRRKEGEGGGLWQQVVAAKVKIERFQRGRLSDWSLEG